MSEDKKEVGDLEKAKIITKVLYGAKKKIMSYELKEKRINFDKDK